MAKKFTPEEITIMESIYQGQSHSTPIQNQQLAQQFGKTPKTIAGWFRSRRRKDVKNGVTLQVNQITDKELHGLRSQLHIHRQRPGTKKEFKAESVTKPEPATEMKPVIETKPITELPRIETLLPYVELTPSAKVSSIESAVKADELFAQIQLSEFGRPETPSANLTDR